jgi:hypothetical protein
VADQDDCPKESPPEAVGEGESQFSYACGHFLTRLSYVSGDLTQVTR